MEGCICHFTKLQIHPFIPKETTQSKLWTRNNYLAWFIFTLCPAVSWFIGHGWLCGYPRQLDLLHVTHFTWLLCVSYFSGLLTLDVCCPSVSDVDPRTAATLHRYSCIWKRARCFLGNKNDLTTYSVWSRCLICEMISRIFFLVSFLAVILFFRQS